MDVKDLLRQSLAVGEEPIDALAPDAELGGVTLREDHCVSLDDGPVVMRPSTAATAVRVRAPRRREFCRGSREQWAIGKAGEDGVGCDERSHGRRIDEALHSCRRQGVRLLRARGLQALPGGESRSVRDAQPICQPHAMTPHRGATGSAYRQPDASDRATAQQIPATTKPMVTTGPTRNKDTSTSGIGW